MPLTNTNTNGTTSGTAAIGVRVKDVAAQAIPVGKRAGTTAVQGVRQGVEGAKEWAAPRLEEAVLGAREWAAPRLEDAADAVDITVAPKVSSALRSTAAQVRPSVTKRTGIRRVLDWRLLLGVGVAMAAAGAGCHHRAAPLRQCHRGGQGRHRVVRGRAGHTGRRHRE